MKTKIKILEVLKSGLIVQIKKDEPLLIPMSGQLNKLIQNGKVQTNKIYMYEECKKPITDGPFKGKTVVTLVFEEVK